ncbi:Exosome complex exonuclease RRP44 [Smittium mucronatum]|uniref:Ribosomal RNA-processing protein 44 n=1 Tax=Smittium mucronatum TaxID=133383 RepID=A0A1R0GM48_9FUNG|nr:Exosome complex exonuclease RRP44 [Smittium mucronatum]
MLKNKSFVKKTRKGNVIRVVKEHYLRDDIHCGFRNCNVDSCVNSRRRILMLHDNDKINIESTEFKKITPLSLDLEDEENQEFQFLIPDTNEFINHIDIFEKPSIKDVIVLETVLDELKGNSLQTYNRVRSIIKDHGATRGYYVFSNEHSKDTFIDRLADETPNDRNDRAIRVASLWYKTHLKLFGIDVLLLTEDAGNRDKSKQMEINTSRMEDYLSAKDNSLELLDMLGNVSVEKDLGWAGYKPYLSKIQIEEGIKNGFFIQGTLKISPYNFLEGSIFGSIKKDDEEQVKILILGRENMNRAIEGDKIVVKLLPRSEWRKSPGELLIDEDEETVPAIPDGNPNIDQSVPETKITNSEPPNKRQKVISTEENLDQKPVEGDVDEIFGEPTATVVGVIRRNWRQYVTFLDPNMAKSSSAKALGTISSVYMLPMDRKIPKIRIRTRQAKELVGKRIVVALDSWPVDSRYPLGHFVRSLGDAGNRNTETDVLLLEHDVPYYEFSSNVLSDLPPEGADWIFNPERDGLTNGSRKDLRHIDVCSIDPPGCTDIDDALHCIKLPNGNFQVGVHIADVTQFVRPGSAIDTEAANRCTSVYLVEKRIDMLPLLLGTNLCSLMSNVERLAFSCIWELDSEANIINVDFFKSVINSRASLTYEEAQARIDDSSMQDNITLSIRNLNMLAKKLKVKRINAGALTLMSPEVRFKLENDSQDPLDVEMKQLKETNSLVEEFMLLANISVARQIYNSFKDKALLRRHPQPPQTNFDNLKAALSNLGIELKTDSSLDLANSLNFAILKTDSYFNTLVRILTTRCMLQAEYFCSGTIPESQYSHYGLATEIYTHFTSPIRRYADVMVHRLLALSIGYEKNSVLDSFDSEKMNDQCKMLNLRHRMAQKASIASIELFTNLFFKGKTVIQEGYITQILQNGFSVLIPHYGIEGIVYTSNEILTKDQNVSSILVYNKESNSLISPLDVSIHLQLFDKVKVLLHVDDKPVSANVSSMRRKISLRLIEPQIEGLSLTPLEREEIMPHLMKSKDLEHKEEEIIELIEKNKIDKIQSL